MLDLESLFKLSYGMCVVSSKKNGRINGCIVNTVFQVVPEPPMAAISVNRKNLTHEYITSSGVFAASILSEQMPVSVIRRFGFRSGRDIDKFEHVRHKAGKTGAPIILDYTVGFLEGEVAQTLDAVTHTLFIAKIVACEAIDDNTEPMTYAFYRDIKHGKTPKTAATYIDVKAKTKKSTGAKDMKKYECLRCGYIYDPEAGDPDNGVEPGTAFDDLPGDWVCPECGAGKDEFEPVED